MIEVLDARIPKRTRDKVAIVGFADGHRDGAPPDGSEYELWGLNRLFKVMDRPWDRWFDIHDLQATYGDGRPGGRDEEWIQFAAQFKGPFYVRLQDVALAKSWGIKHATAYPMDAVLEAYPRYFTNSISYMIALATLMGYGGLAVYGVDMAQDAIGAQNEYRHQRPSCEFFLGAAMAKGIQVEIPVGSDLLRSSHLYGMEDDTGIQLKRRSRLNELGARKEGLKQQMAQIEGQQGAQNHMWEQQKKQLFAGINQLDGAMQEVQFEMIQLSPEPVQPLE